MKNTPVLLKNLHMNEDLKLHKSVSMVHQMGSLKHVI